MTDMSHGLQGQQVNITQEAMKEIAADNKLEKTAEIISAKESIQMALQETANPFAAKTKKKKKSLKSQLKRVSKAQKGADKEERLLPIKLIEDKAQQFNQRNPELKSDTLKNLREWIHPNDSKKQILSKIMQYYPDETLTDEALDFLLETTEGELHEKIREIKEEFNETNEREISAGRNIMSQARQASEKGLGTPTNMRDLYRDITGNPRDSNTLFSELSQKYAFKDLKKVVNFLLHSLGRDMKSKGPSIPKGMLHRLLAETRSLQAILGVYRFFQGRMNLMETLFTKDGLKLPKQLTFEMMAKVFMNLAGERYPNSDKVLQSAKRLGIEDWILAKIIALSQFRDAVRQVSVNQVYKSLQHRDEFYLAILEALEDLEDELEEMIEEDEEEEEGEEENEES